MHRRNGPGGRPGTRRPWRQTSWGQRETASGQWDQEALHGEGHVLARDTLSGAAFPLLVPSAPWGSFCLRGSRKVWQPPPRGRAPGHRPFHPNPQSKLRCLGPQPPSHWLHSCPLALGSPLVGAGRFLRWGSSLKCDTGRCATAWWLCCVTCSPAPAAHIACPALASSLPVPYCWSGRLCPHRPSGILALEACIPGMKGVGERTAWEGGQQEDARAQLWAWGQGHSPI